MNMRFFVLYVIAFVLSACTPSKTVYHRHDLTMSVIQKEFIEKKRPVNIRFYVRRDQMFENSGYILPSAKEGCILFQYYDSDLRKFIDLEIPLTNISEISYKTGAFELNRNAQIAGTAALFVTLIIAAGIWIN